MTKMDRAPGKVVSCPLPDIAAQVHLIPSQKTITLRKTFSPIRVHTILLGPGPSPRPLSPSREHLPQAPKAGHPGAWHSQQASAPSTAQWVLEHPEEWAFLASEGKPGNQINTSGWPPPLSGLIHEAQACPLTARPALCAQKNTAALSRRLPRFSEEPRP